MAKEKRFDVIVCFPPGVSGARYAINDTVNGTRVVTVLDNDVEYTKIKVWVDWLNGLEDENEVLATVKACQLSLGALPAVVNLPMSLTDPKLPTLARIAAVADVALSRACRKVNAVPQNVITPVALSFATRYIDSTTTCYMANPFDKGNKPTACTAFMHDESYTMPSENTYKTEW